MFPVLSSGYCYFLQTVRDELMVNSCMTGTTYLEQFPQAVQINTEEHEINMHCVLPSFVLSSEEEQDKWSKS